MNWQNDTSLKFSGLSFGALNGAIFFSPGHENVSYMKERHSYRGSPLAYSWKPHSKLIWLQCLTFSHFCLFLIFFFSYPGYFSHSHTVSFLYDTESIAIKRYRCSEQWMWTKKTTRMNITRKLIVENWQIKSFRNRMMILTWMLQWLFREKISLNNFLFQTANGQRPTITARCHCWCVYARCVNTNLYDVYMYYYIMHTLLILLLCVNYHMHYIVSSRALNWLVLRTENWLSLTGNCI